MQLAKGLSISLVAAMIASPAMTQEEEGFVERIDVEVTSVDVFVRDADGNPVRGLTAEDFAIYADGVEQEITNFYEATVVEPGTNRNRLSGPAIEPTFTAERGAASTEQHFIIYIERTAFTHFSRDNAAEDLRELVQTLSDRSIPVMMIVENLVEKRTVVPFGASIDEMMAVLDEIATTRALNLPDLLRRRLLAIENTIVVASGLEGRKAMVMVLGPLNARSHIRRIVASANEANVTLYPMFGGGLSLYEIRDAKAMPGDLPLVPMEIRQSFETFNYLARETGGVTAPPTNGFEHINRKAADDVSFYYSLGFRSESSPRRSSIRVEVDRPGATVRHRLEVLRITPRERAELQTIASLVLPETIEQPEELRFESRVLGVERESWRRNIVSLELSIPFEELVLHTGDAGLEGAFTVLIAAADEAGKLSNIAEQTHRFELEERDRLALEGDSYAYVVPMRMRRGEHVLVVTVMDETSQIRGIRKITIPSG